MLHFVRLDVPVNLVFEEIHALVTGLVSVAQRLELGKIFYPVARVVGTRALPLFRSPIFFFLAICIHAQVTEQRCVPAASPDVSRQIVFVTLPASFAQALIALRSAVTDWT